MKSAAGRSLFAALLLLPLAPAPAPAAEMFQLARSPGGLPFWHVRRKDEPRAVLVGSFYDAFALAHPDKISTALVGASLMESGPRGMSEGEFNELLKDTQARCGISAGAMSSSFSVEAKPEDLGDALDTCFRALNEPALRGKDFVRLRKSAVESRSRLETNRGALAGHLMRRLTWGASPFARWSEPDEIAKISAEDVETWRRAVFARDNLIIVAVGAPDAAEFGALIDRGFGGLPENAAVSAGAVAPPAYPAKTIVFEKDGEQTALLIEGALDIDNAEGPAATAGNNVLGGGMDRRLGRAVRGEQGATYSISSGLGQLAPGLRTFSVRSALANDLAASAIARARAEIERWRADGATPQEVEAARGQLAAGFDKSAESPGGKAFALVSMLRTGRTAQDEALYTQKLRALGADEVNRVIREKMPRVLTTIIVAPKAEGLGADCVIRAIAEIDTCR